MGGGCGYGDIVGCCGTTVYVVITTAETTWSGGDCISAAVAIGIYVSGTGGYGDNDEVGCDTTAVSVSTGVVVTTAATTGNSDDRDSTAVACGADVDDADRRRHSRRPWQHNHWGHRAPQ